MRKAATRKPSAKTRKPVASPPIPRPARNLYTLEFTEAQWEELVAMSFEPFDFGEGDALTRGQWMACAHMALGKAQRVESGDYGGPVDHEWYETSDQWAEQLRDIAAVILAHFRPGDMQL